MNEFDLNREFAARTVVSSSNNDSLKMSSGDDCDSAEDAFSQQYEEENSSSNLSELGEEAQVLLPMMTAPFVASKQYIAKLMEEINMAKEPLSCFQSVGPLHDSASSAFEEFVEESKLIIRRIDAALAKEDTEVSATSNLKSHFTKFSDYKGSLKNGNDLDLCHDTCNSAASREVTLNLFENDSLLCDYVDDYSKDSLAKFVPENLGQVGTKVRCKTSYGIIRYVGPLPPNKGIWYGIEWEDSLRGKHNGIYGNIPLFQTRTPLSGSFLLAGKASLGITLEEAIIEKYQDSVEIESDITDELKKNIRAKFVEVVGMEKVGAKQRNLANLFSVVLDGVPVYGAASSSLFYMIPRARDLDISNSFLVCWIRLAYIVSQLPGLHFLNVSGNSLVCPSEETKVILQPHFKHVLHLVLNHMKSYNWEDLMSCASMFCNLSKLQLAFNKLTNLSEVPQENFQKLEVLDLSHNPLNDWKEVNKIGGLPFLKSLNLTSCALKAVEFPGVRPSSKTALFSKLQILLLGDNPIYPSNWGSVGELSKLFCLEELVMNFNEKTDLNFFEFTTARIKTLKMLNRTVIDTKTRRDSEKFYMKIFGKDYYLSGGLSVCCSESILTEEFLTNHPTFSLLIDEYGAPVHEAVYEVPTKKMKDTKIVMHVDAPEIRTKSSNTLAFFPNTKILKVKMMVKRSLCLPPNLSVSLSYIPQQRQVDIPIDDDSKELSFFGPTSGDKLKVKLPDSTKNMFVAPTESSRARPSGPPRFRHPHSSGMHRPSTYFNPRGPGRFRRPLNAAPPPPPPRASEGSSSEFGFVQSRSLGNGLDAGLSMHPPQTEF